ncbi:MAG: NADH-quinone oxidoreductase subunit I [Bacteroidales bacterium]|nr:NADH-quinone oxidoreductase subunit I [Bacteroidales bacterium]
MGSVKDYFKSLGSGISSLLKGMQVTGKEFVTPKITEFYPEDRTTYKWPERFRAILQLKYDAEGNHKCIACGTCERVCPNGTIALETKTIDTWDGRKKKKLDKYFYDLGSCTFCQLCVTNCPTDALEFSNDFEQAVFTRDKLLKKLNYLPEKPEPEPTEEEKAKILAEKEAKLAAAKAAAAKAAAAKAAGAKPAGATTNAGRPVASTEAKAPATPATAQKAAAPAAGAVDKTAAVLANLRKAVETAETPEAKAAAEAKLAKVEAALKAKAEREGKV